MDMTDTRGRKTNVSGGVDSLNLPALLTIDQSAEVLQVAPRTVNRMCVDGELRAVKVRRQWRVNRDALLAFAGLN